MLSNDNMKDDFEPFIPQAQQQQPPPPPPPPHQQVPKDSLLKQTRKTPKPHFSHLQHGYTNIMNGSEQFYFLNMPYSAQGALGDASGTWSAAAASNAATADPMAFMNTYAPDMNAFDPFMGFQLAYNFGYAGTGDYATWTGIPTPQMNNGSRKTLYDEYYRDNRHQGLPQQQQQPQPQTQIASSVNTSTSTENSNSEQMAKIEQGINAVNLNSSGEKCGENPADTSSDSSNTNTTSSSANFNTLAQQQTQPLMNSKRNGSGKSWASVVSSPLGSKKNNSGNKNVGYNQSARNANNSLLMNQAGPFDMYAPLLNIDLRSQMINANTNKVSANSALAFYSQGNLITTPFQVPGTENSKNGGQKASNGNNSGSNTMNNMSSSSLSPNADSFNSQQLPYHFNRNFNNNNNNAFAGLQPYYTAPNFMNYNNMYNSGNSYNKGRGYNNFNKSNSYHQKMFNNNQGGYNSNREPMSNRSPSSDPSATLAQTPYNSDSMSKMTLQNQYNPREFNLVPKGARFFVIKSYSEDDVHRSIKYKIWCSTEHGNRRLDQAYREREGKGPVYLFFSVNGSGHFCGMAEMTSPVDYDSKSSVWSQDKWKGKFEVNWIYVKDVPNSQLRNIRLENNENKPVTNSRDTQEVPFEKGKQVLRVFYNYRHTTSIFDDFEHYEKRQGEDNKKWVDEDGGAGEAPADTTAETNANVNSMSRSPSQVGSITINNNNTLTPNNNVPAQPTKPQKPQLQQQQQSATTTA